MLRKARNAPFLKLHVSWSGCRLSSADMDSRSWVAKEKEEERGRQGQDGSEGCTSGGSCGGNAGRVSEFEKLEPAGFKEWYSCCLTVKNWREDVGHRVIKLFQWLRTLAGGVVERRSSGPGTNSKMIIKSCPQNRPETRKRRNCDK